MTQEEALRMTRQAKSSHIRWLAYVHAMLAGLEIEERLAPVSHRQCAFGQWFYRDGFKTFAHWPVFQDVEYSHELLHAVYKRIHQALGAGDHGQAADLMQRLLGISAALLQGLDLLREEILNSELEAF